MGGESIAYLLIGVAVAFNCLVIKHKVEKQRWADGALDAALLIVLSFLFMGSFGGLVVSTIASAIISVYLYIFPPKLPSFDLL